MEHEDSYKQYIVVAYRFSFNLYWFFKSLKQTEDVYSVCLLDTQTRQPLTVVNNSGTVTLDFLEV